MYEQFRNDFMICASSMNQSDLKNMLVILDKLSVKYDFSRKETSIAVYMQELPESAKAYLVCKKLAGLSDHTLKNYKITLGVFFRTVQKMPEKITTNDIRLFLYVHQEQKKVSMKTLDKYRECISCYFAWCYNEGYIQSNPAKSLVPIKYEHKPREALTQVELEQLRAACDDLREHAIIEVLYSTGCRVSELTALKQSDIDWSEKSVHLFGKGKKHRTSFLNAKAEVALKAYLASRSDDCEYLIVTNRKPYRRISNAGIQKIVRKLSSRASFSSGKSVTPHILRHTTATTALHRGMPITDISKLLGHENISTTMIYAKTSIADVKMGHSKYIA